MNNDQGLSKLFSVLLLVAAATLGWIGLKNPGVSRVADNRTSAQIPADEQDVIARLWEDPLQAVQAELSKPDRGKSATTNQGDASLKHTVEAMKRAVTDKAGTKKLCLLVVPIPDTPFPDDLETRLRLRYSVQMALAAENLAPDNRNALGYFKLPPPPNTNPPESEMYVPYEWFIPRRKTATNVVLVLWLPEGRLSRAPLDLLKQLQDLLIPSELPPSLGAYPYVFVIGPRSSDTLKKMVPDADMPGRQDNFTLINKLSIFSPQATTPDPLIGLAPQMKWPKARDDFARKLHKALTGSTNGFGATNSWRYFHNFIAPDDQLTDLLVAELALRGVNLAMDSKDTTEDKILILAEADTQYGRSLPLALQASLHNYRTEAIHYSTRCPDSWSLTPRQIKLYGEQPPDDSQLLIHRYLRGLDQQKGHEGNAKATVRSGAKSPEEALAEVLSKQGAMSLGESQLDYVDRLAEDFQRGTNTGKIKAVGVLGGDLYDKLILLRSLRSKFPAAVFFTTDLDARMWHSDHLLFTRNMVVASAYGVNVVGRNDDEARQKADAPKIPPFRDGYQVAVFNACQAALRKAADPVTIIAPRLQPSIYELGRNGPVELKPLTDDSPAERNGMLKETWKATMNPVMPKLTSGQRMGLSLSLAGGLLTLGLLMATPASRTWGKTHPRIIGCVAASLILLCWFCVAILHFTELPGGERWAWNQGTSIWPTELMRLLIICSVFTTFIWAWQHYVKARERLIGGFFPEDKIQLAAITRSGVRLSWWYKLWSWLEELFSNSFAALQSNNAANLFQTYVNKARLKCRALRVSLATAAYMLLAFGLVFLVDGGMPDRLHIRGEVAQHWDKFLLICSIICFLSLVFYVLDAVLISAELLYSLSDPKTKTAWPKKLVTQAQDRFGVQEEDLPGYLDVQFAAEKSEETGKLILIPFIIQFLFILSRNSYFDNWTWPGTLVAIFVCNILLACTGWMILRRCAKNIRLEAMKKLKDSLDETSRNLRKMPAERKETTPWHALSRVFVQWARKGSAEPDEPRAETTNSKDRHDGLLKMQKLIEEEHRGAYAHFFQDPALFAVLLPSGVFGILAVLVRALFGGM